MFNKGDCVICKETKGSRGISVGKKYTVIDNFYVHNWKCIYIENDNNQFGYYDPSRFEFDFIGTRKNKLKKILSI